MKNRDVSLRSLIEFALKRYVHFFVVLALVSAVFLSYSLFFSAENYNRFCRVNVQYKYYGAVTDADTYMLPQIYSNAYSTVVDADFKDKIYQIAKNCGLTQKQIADGIHFYRADNDYVCEMVLSDKQLIQDIAALFEEMVTERVGNLAIYADRGGFSSIVSERPMFDVKQRFTVGTAVAAIAVSAAVYAVYVLLAYIYNPKFNNISELESFGIKILSNSGDFFCAAVYAEIGDKKSYGIIDFDCDGAAGFANALRQKGYTVATGDAANECDFAVYGLDADCKEYLKTAKKVDCVVLCVDLRKTKIQQVVAAQNDLQFVGVNITGAVVKC